MAKIGYNTFKGEIPRTDPHLLPGSNSQLAKNCVFDSGSLEAVKAGLELGAMANNPIRGLYTENGISFYTWSEETLAFKSPIVDDSFNRVYFLQPSNGEFRVTTTLQMAANGPSPTQYWKVGVPQPTVAPVLSLIARNTLPEYPNTTVSVASWWESSSVQYGLTTPSLTTVKAWIEYTFTPPSKPTNTPDGAVLRATFTIRDVNANKDITSVTMTAGSSGRSSALPGGFEASLAAGGKLSLVWGVTDTRAYTYVNQNDWDEEGATAPPATISPTYIQDVQVVLTASTFTGMRPFKQFNIYRTYGTGTTYIKTYCAGSGLTWVDSSRAPSSVGSALESKDWSPAPAGLQGVALMAAGWFAGFKGNTLHMSEVYRPHGWAYSKTFPKAIRGICPTAGGLVVTCADGCYLLNGTFPSSATQMGLNFPQPGIAQRAMVEIDGAVAYATHDGIALVSGSQGSMTAGQNLFTRLKWRERYASILQTADVRFSYHDGMLVMTSSSNPSGFVVRLDEDVGSFVRIDEVMDCTFLLPVSDALYYSRSNKLYQFRGSGTKAEFDWWSKSHIMTKPVNFGAGQLVADGPVRLTIYAEGVEVYDETIEPGYFRIGTANPQNHWSFRLRGTNTVSEIYLARDFRELRHG